MFKYILLWSVEQRFEIFPLIFRVFVDSKKSGSRKYLKGNHSICCVEEINSQ